MRFDILDNYLQSLVNMMSSEFFSVKGVLGRVGGLEETVTITTETKFGTLENKVKGGRFDEAGEAE